jgi:hypothetical protein|nr:MAG TPA: hypothetical protein [Caudoviricetes sp.]
MKTIPLFYETLLPLSNKEERDTLFKSLIDVEISRLFEDFFRKDEYLRNFFKDDPNRCLALRVNDNIYERVEGTGTTYLFDVTIDLYKAHAASNAIVHKVTLSGLYVGVAVGDQCMFCVDNATDAVRMIRDNLSYFLTFNGVQYRIYPMGV